MLASCTSRSYSPLSAPPGHVPLTPAVTNPEIVVLPQESAPVIGLDKFDAGPLPAPTATNVVPPAPAPSLTFARGWIPLREWSDRCGVGTPERRVSGGATVYRVATRNGTCTLTIGSRRAFWNGITIWLGFAPQLVQGEPRIHGLDAEKTLLPLAQLPERPRTGGRVVVLDPGHGGSDSGTRGAHHELEKTYTLDWALRTERLLTNAGWKVFLTRRSDVDVSLAERVAFADRVHADLFISLHFNSTFPQTQPSGIETYCLTPSGMPSTLARGYADEERAVFSNNAFDQANTDWAFRIHRALLARTQAHDDGIKRARFMSVLRYQNRPAILVEGGFLSNPAEMASVGSPGYRERLAQAVAEALK
jgi:N-acetylmuramoyl-L-alanine amidase